MIFHGFSWFSIPVFIIRITHGSHYLVGEKAYYVLPNYGSYIMKREKAAIFIRNSSGKGQMYEIREHGQRLYGNTDKVKELWDRRWLYRAVGRWGCENVEDESFRWLRRGRVVAQTDGATEARSAGTSGNG